jgi:catechol 2,3-dioxygenase-like lactoylglutathione lyase family enzyme
MTHDHDNEHDHEHHHHDFGPRHFIMATPGLLVDDVQTTADYYRDILGFDIRFTYGEPPTFAVVDRGDVSVHLVRSDPPGRRNGMAAAGPGNGNDFYVDVTDIDELHAELTGRGARVLSEPQTWPYGMREFNIEDLNGYRIIFGQAVEASET